MINEYSYVSANAHTNRINHEYGKDGNRGSALAMAIAMIAVVTILLAAILPIASQVINSSKRENYGLQSEYLARSVAQMITEYIVNDPDSEYSKNIIKQAVDAGTAGITYDAQGISKDMGTCTVNIVINNGIMSIKATANYMNEIKDVTAVLQQTSGISGEVVTSTPMIQGTSGNVFTTISGNYTNSNIPEGKVGQNVNINVADIKNVKDFGITTDKFIDDRSSESSYTAYKATVSQTFAGTFNVDSYGDVYIIIPAGVILSFQDISNSFYCGNLYFIVESGGELVLGRTNKSVDIHANIYGMPGSTVRIKGTNAAITSNNVSKITGTCNISSLIIEKRGVILQYAAPNELSGGTGSVETIDSDWRLIRYTN